MPCVTTHRLAINGYVLDLSLQELDVFDPSPLLVFVCPYASYERQKVEGWCREGESNPQGRKARRILRPFWAVLETC
jgi:hypothetical protein